MKATINLVLFRILLGSLGLGVALIVAFIAGFDIPPLREAWEWSQKSVFFLFE
jgi:hypothetical protein